MANFKQYILLLFLVTVIFCSCSKQGVTSTSESNNQQNIVSQSVVYNNITINPSANHVFSVPYLTQAVIDKGSLKVYAASSMSTQATQWEILNSCEAHMDINSVTVGNVQIQNNSSSPVSMSFRFDVSDN